MLEKISRFYHWMGGFIVNIAFFNAIGFCATVGGTVYMDRHLTSNIVYGARHYALGYWSLVLGPIIFVATLVFPRWGKSWRKTTGPSIILGVAGIITLVCFSFATSARCPSCAPEIPHSGVLSWLMGFVLISWIASVIHFAPIEDLPWIINKTLAPEAKIERVKELIQFWRTIAVSLTVGYLALIVPMSNAMTATVEHMVTEPVDKYLLIRFGIVGLTIVTVYVGLCVVKESFLKASLAADLLLSKDLR